SSATEPPRATCSVGNSSGTLPTAYQDGGEPSRRWAAPLWGERSPVRGPTRPAWRCSTPAHAVASRSVPPPRPGRLVIGLAELVDLPEWRIVRLRAKVDTGARSSALHVENIAEIATSPGRFDVILRCTRS